MIAPDRSVAHEHDRGRGRRFCVDRRHSVAASHRGAPIGAAEPASPVPRERYRDEVVRNGLTAGVAFLANRDGSADVAGAPGENIVVRAGRAFERRIAHRLAGADRRRPGWQAAG